MTDVKIDKLMRLLKRDQKGSADLQRAHELIRTIVQHAPSRPQLDTAARTSLQVPCCLVSGTSPFPGLQLFCCII